MWHQRARADVLKYGDTNTRWFHSRASMKCKQNNILKILDDHGVLHTDPEAIQK